MTLEEQPGDWVYAITFGERTPTAVERAKEYSDRCVSAEDLHKIRHFVLFKAGKIVQIQLHDALRILPHFDPERPETIRMPAVHGFMSGEPPEPTMRFSFKAEPEGSRTAYGISPDVYLVFDGPELASLYLHNAVALDPDSPSSSVRTGLGSWIRAAWSRGRFWRAKHPGEN
jgi:hypothetical protein